MGGRGRALRRRAAAVARAALLVTLVALLAGVARAADAAPGPGGAPSGNLPAGMDRASPASVYAVAWPRDLSATLAPLLIVGLLDGAVAPSLRGSAACRPSANGGHCDATALLAIDRAGLRHDGRAWRRTSDVLQPGLLGLAAVATAALAVHDAWGSNPALAAAQDVLVATQAVAAATLATSLLKYAVRRPRPAGYRDGAGDGLEQVLSFPSGHTSAVTAAAVAWAATVQLRRPSGGVHLWAWSLAAASSATMATARVLGGKHFPTDVIAGAVVGGALGYVVPALHRRGTPVQILPEFGSRPSLALRLTF